MSKRTPSRVGRRALAVPAIAAVVFAGACSTVEESDEETIGTGVTSEPCPDAVNPDNGCIYLGVLSDLEGGPVAALAVPMNEGQIAFWRTVNENGGIGGYDIDVTANTRNTAYDPQRHAAAYQQIEPNILALAMSLGTINTEAVLDQMDASDLVAVPGAWWSGFQFPDTDLGLILESGYSYCTESVIGLDWFAETHGKPETVVTVGFPGDYGGDSAEGARLWAEANDVEVSAQIDSAPNQIAGNQAAAIGQIVSLQPDVVLLAVTPAEAAEIVAGSVQAGYAGRFMGSVPSFNPALLNTPAAGALTSLYNHIGPWQGWDGDSEGITAIKESTGGTLPSNQGYLFGWTLSYPIKALLEKAADEGTLTRAGLRDAVEGLEVDYQGILPTATLGEQPSLDSQSATISVPDPAVELGVRTLVNDFRASTEIDYSGPCSDS
ncbi:ABC transporter substrate-binding protein [Rhodococcus triatomae]|uniref:ABC-type branched-chain amino acid transport system, substrate-binding protein n=1 Tax=Rhodococcus triatomae TaxID=300028 RepID=A0A1G8MS18_9NOCA|nr:ABC transporter substrate-binding protein [Rhodococcus triatomae]QNG19075.1 ABC transporter substrate-binding protein [Rhodococcus triatomae]QNG25012.1 ABC transporter substrate-binding protein [Rhodococcus triatomae]SDI70838.1 ABC-type branched-chain amino acid transport system, substrate-binding protein [Rhodococcus triatomae]